MSVLYDKMHTEEVPLSTENAIGIIVFWYFLIPFVTAWTNALYAIPLIFPILIGIPYVWLWGVPTWFLWRYLALHTCAATIGLGFGLFVAILLHIQSEQKEKKKC